MPLDRKVHQLARKLVAASLEDGQLSAARVEAVLALLRKQPERQRKPLLLAYLRLMRREEARSHLIIEYAGPLSDEARDAIVRNMSTRAGRKLTVETRELPSLIGGVRVRLGDDVFDASIATRLAQLERTV